MTTARACGNCKHWKRTRPGANWGFCTFVNLDFAGKLAFVYTFGADFIRHPEMRVELQTRDVFYCANFEPTGKAAHLEHTNLRAKLEDDLLTNVIEEVSKLTQDQLRSKLVELKSSQLTRTHLNEDGSD